MADGIQLHGISQAVFDFIVEFEASSEAAYNVRGERPLKAPSRITKAIS
jgi:hypothetical protein